MVKKRANGEGSLRRRSDGRWEGRYTAGHDPETGKAIYKKCAGKNEKECKEKLAAALEQAGKVDASKTGQFTVGQWAETWFENFAKPSVRETTATYYKNYIDKHIVPNIGKIKLNKLTTLNIQKFYYFREKRQENGFGCGKMEGMEYMDLREAGREGLKEIRRQVVRLKKLGKTGKEIEELTGVRQNRASEIWTPHQRNAIKEPLKNR